MLTLLPEWKRTIKPFERLGELKIDEEKKDLIIWWWKENPEIFKEIEDLKQVAISPSLPKEEAGAIKDILVQAEQLFTSANNLMLIFIKSARIERSGDWLRHLILNYINTFGLAQIPKQAENAANEIEQYKKRQKAFLLVTKIGRAIIKSRNANPTDATYCQKMAQSALKLIFEQMLAKRADEEDKTGNDSTPIIGALVEEILDLTSVFSSDLWSEEETKKMFGYFDRLRRVLEKQQIGTSEKIGLITLWGWANGEKPEELNVFKILRFSNELNTNLTYITADAWLAEEDRI